MLKNYRNVLFAPVVWKEDITLSKLRGGLLKDNLMAAVDSKYEPYCLCCIFSSSTLGGTLPVDHREQVLCIWRRLEYHFLFVTENVETLDGALPRVDVHHLPLTKTSAHNQNLSSFQRGSPLNITRCGCRCVYWSHLKINTLSSVAFIYYIPLLSRDGAHTDKTYIIVF